MLRKIKTTGFISDYYRAVTVCDYRIYEWAGSSCIQNSRYHAGESRA